jgi:hypothetical protein
MIERERAAMTELTCRPADLSSSPSCSNPILLAGKGILALRHAHHHTIIGGSRLSSHARS